LAAYVFSLFFGAFWEQIKDNIAKPCPKPLL
jgi:hypothetical protein